jgi:hypothetical protein
MPCLPVYIPTFPLRSIHIKPDQHKKLDISTIYLVAHSPLLIIAIFSFIGIDMGTFLGILEKGSLAGHLTLLSWSHMPVDIKEKLFE